jgi:purine-binding chemotaxis protein CheW
MVAAQPGERSGRTRLVCFWLRGQEYGTDIADVAETLALRPITRVFLTPDWLAGIINLRGDVVPVIDLGALLGLPRAEPSGDTRVLLARRAGRVAGLLVDAMAELRSCERARLQSPPPTLSADVAAMLVGIDTVEQAAPLRVIDLGRLFDSDRVRALERAT